MDISRKEDNQPPVHPAQVQEQNLHHHEALFPPYYYTALPDDFKERFETLHRQERSFSYHAINLTVAATDDAPIQALVGCRRQVMGEWAFRCKFLSSQSTLRCFKL